MTNLLSRPDAGVLAAARTPFCAQGGAFSQLDVTTLAVQALQSLDLATLEGASPIAGVVLATDYHGVEAARIHEALVSAWPVLGGAPLLGVVSGGAAAGLLALDAASRLAAGSAVLVVGCDSASTAPHFLPRSTLGARLGHGALRSAVGALPESTGASAPSYGLAAVTAGSRRAPVQVTEDESGTGAGDGAAALLVSASFTPRLVRGDDSVSVGLPRGRPVPPGAAGLGAVCDVLAAEGSEIRGLCQAAGHSLALGF